jgi:hypothetical protein
MTPRRQLAPAFALAFTALVLGCPSGHALGAGRGERTLQPAAESSSSPRPDQAALATQSDAELALSRLPGPGRVVVRAAGTGRGTSLPRSGRLTTSAGRTSAPVPIARRRAAPLATGSASELKRLLARRPGARDLPEVSA